MASFNPPTNIINRYNPSYFSATTSTNKYLTKTTADDRYVKLTGGSITGLITCQAGIQTTGITNTGSFSTTGDISTSNGSIKGNIQATSISNSGTFSNTGNINSVNGNIIATQGIIGGQTLQIQPTSTFGTTQNTSILNYSGTIESGNFDPAWVKTPTSQTIFFDNSPRSGLILGYIQVKYKVRPDLGDYGFGASFSFISSLAYGTGLVNISGASPKGNTDLFSYSALSGENYGVLLSCYSLITPNYTVHSGNHSVSMWMLSPNLGSAQYYTMSIPDGTYDYNGLAAAFQNALRNVKFGLYHPWANCSIQVDPTTYKTSITTGNSDNRVIVSFKNQRNNTTVSNGDTFAWYLFNLDETMPSGTLTSSKQAYKLDQNPCKLTYNFVILNSD